MGKMEDPLIRLLGASDGGLDTTSRAKQYYQVDLDNDVLQELVACSRRGKPPQVILGRNSVRIRKGHILAKKRLTDSL
jgi:hypothetical protein